MIYALLFLFPVCLLLLSEYRLRSWRARNPSYLPNEIYNLQRKLLDSRPRPPSQGLLKWLFYILGRPSQTTLDSFQPENQIGSRLLFALPTEIRLEIYKLVVGNSRIHCVPLHKSVGYFSCPKPLECECQAKLFGNGRYFQLWRNVKAVPAAKPNLELLRTCRQVYVEASDFFYTSNVFVIHSLWTPHDMENVVKPHRLQQIRKLSLNFSFGAHGIIPLMSPISQNPMHYPATDNAWIEAWNCLSTHFLGVEELSITLEMRSLDLFIEHQGQAWIRPLLETAKMPLRKCTINLAGWDARFKTRIDEIPDLEHELECVLLKKRENIRISCSGS